jgi:hypothetical protein
MLSFVDHLVIGVPHLSVATDWAIQHLGQPPVYGGQHLGFGTHNSLLGLGPSTYLEFLAPDPKQTPPASGYWMKVDQVQTPRFIRWAARSQHIQEDVAKAAAAAWDLGKVLPGNRQRADGSSLRWQLSDPNQNSSEGVLPFLIDWGDSIHPASGLPQVGQLISLTLSHPDAGRIQQQLASIGIDLPVRLNPAPGLSARIFSASGTITLP